VARVTLQTIAERVGVSRMTVSNAFSRPDQLSPELRGRILDAAEELGYAGPDPAARALARGRSGAVGVLLTDSLGLAFTDEVATGFLGAVTAALAPTGLALTLLPGAPADLPATSPLEDELRRLVVPARDVALDGALVYSCDQQSPGTEWLIRRNIPLVFVDQFPEPGRACVNIDDRGGARAAAQHLVDLGHRRVAIITSDVHWQGGPAPAVPDVAGRVSRERLAGWTDALDAAGIEPETRFVPTYAPEANRAAANDLLDRSPAPTAILCQSDVIAQAVVTTAQDRGIPVPYQLSVVGFDDSPLATRMRPTLTTVRQDLAAKGRAAIAALTAQLSDPAHPPQSVVLPTELVVRSSTAPPAESLSD
jgi:DNA-binding LacI/PurR family transcriptional regulator